MGPARERAGRGTDMPRFEVKGRIDDRPCTTVYESIDVQHAEARGTLDGMVVDEIRDLSTPNALPVRSERAKRDRRCPLCGGLLQNAWRREPDMRACAIGASAMIAGALFLLLGGEVAILGLPAGGLGLGLCFVSRSVKVVRCRDCHAIAAQWE
jgi:hypothetical protein